VSVDVTNNGSLPGDEIVQLYVKDLYSSVTVYESQLRGFERIHLRPGETKTVHFTLKPSDLELLNRHMEWVVEPGEFQICIGSHSEDIRLKETIELRE
jgi:beta-glucosidase